jgi:transcriptional regulator with XRE-family HTH domain
MSKTCPKCFGSGTLPDQKAIGKVMRKRREQAGIGLRQMARQVKVCPSLLSRLERGLAVWNLSLITRLDNALNG